jgi:hypothetical protein
VGLHPLSQAIVDTLLMGTLLLDSLLEFPSTSYKTF